MKINNKLIQLLGKDASAELKRMEKLDRDQSTRRNTFWPQLPAGQRAQRYRENEESTL